MEGPPPGWRGGVASGTVACRPGGVHASPGAAPPCRNVRGRRVHRGGRACGHCGDCAFHAQRAAASRIFVKTLAVMAIVLALLASVSTGFVVTTPPGEDAFPPVQQRPVVAGMLLLIAACSPHPVQRFLGGMHIFAETLTVKAFTRAAEAGYMPGYVEAMTQVMEGPSLACAMLWRATRPLAAQIEFLLHLARRRHAASHSRALSDARQQQYRCACVPRGRCRVAPHAVRCRGRARSRTVRWCISMPARCSPLPSAALAPRGGQVAVTASA